MKIFITLAICLICLDVYSQDVDKIEKNIILKSINEGELSKINKDLSIKYGQKKADSIILNAKAQFFWNKKDYALYVKEFVKSVELNQPNNFPSDKNSSAWRVFDWSKVSLKDASAKNRYQFLDTYANLLLKLGRQQDAIKWSEQALALAPENEKTPYKATLEKIKIGERTW